MLTEQQYRELINEAITAINYPAEPSGLYQPISYTLAGGGKRLRPILLLAAAHSCGTAPDKAMKQALGIEMFHNFTLLHDDVMDNADMRHGRPTVHKRWNNPTAILSGDAMLTMATSMISDCRPDKLRNVLDLFNKTAMEIYQGQQYDMDFEQMPGLVSVNQYMHMIRLKTSVLLGCACQMGALVAGAEESTQKALYRFGENLGLAFQLQDDWLDTFGNPDIFGKNIGGDILNDKQTFLLISTINKASEKQRQRLASMAGQRSVEKIEYYTHLYRELGAEPECRQMINHYGSESIKALNQSGIPADAINFFTNLAQASLTRTH
ncbi:polyprenyl synthetase family protein [uncultured Muribaculum sp.]|uniref:polyprenyl synthetase family protein n=1 Tax=uncultured Muribaculum sp. TaxID=1918613 RepID=UPI0026DF5271|nr:polyprenyl synthetase family protein [uncultured Muribaculum sp.]